MVFILYLKPLERVRLMWKSLFIVRMWRHYIIKSRRLTIEKNFLTHYSYVCLELNAHSIVQIILFLKERNMSGQFLPDLINSHACESFFGKLRSFTSTFSTVVNCTTKQFIERVSRIDLLNDIAANTEEFVFPKSRNASVSHARNIYELPSKSEIYSEIERSQQEAIREAIGIECERPFDCMNVTQMIYKTISHQTIFNVSSIFSILI